MAGSPAPQIGGQVRDKENWIGGNDYNPCGAAFVPPPTEEVGWLLDDLCRFSSSEMLPPLAQVAIAHAQFETIHLFIDGNGRTGRALVQVLLRRRGLAPRYVPPISVVLASDKARYISGLTAFREGAVAGWIHDFAVASARAAHLAERYVANAEDLTEAWTQKLRAGSNPRSDAAAWAVIDVLIGYPVVAVAAAVAAGWDYLCGTQSLAEAWKEHGGSGSPEVECRRHGHRRSLFVPAFPPCGNPSAGGLYNICAGLCTENERSEGDSQPIEWSA